MASTSDRQSCLPPPQLWGCDHVFTQHVKVFIGQVMALEESITYPGTYTLFGHPMNLVNVMGYVVSVLEREKYHKFEVDDGTGVISVTCWKSVTDDDGQYADIRLGDLVSVYGKLSNFRDKKEITVNYIHKELDLNAELLFWLDTIRLGTVYKAPFSTPKQSEMNK